MAAFDRIPSGLPAVDEMLDNIRLGDNVVWQVTEVAEFSPFAERFVRQAVADGRDVTYVRFAQHDPVVCDLSGVRVVELNPDMGFEPFTVAIYDEVTRQGREAFYVFDCLSELQSVWYTDLMMGNFFCVTCPYLFELDTVAYFPLLRGRHSFDAIARIRDTTQVLVDVHTGDACTYVHPLKVWNRSSDRMFMPHGWNRSDGSFFTVGNGVSISRYYQTVQQAAERGQNQEVDSHDRFFDMAKAAWRAGCFTAEMEEQIVDSTMTKDARLKELVRRYFSPEDYFRLRTRMIGSGAIGGKACGMLLARKAAASEVPAFAKHSEPHDSFYIGSDVFYTFLVSNGAWHLRVRQRTPEGYFALADELAGRIRTGRFPDKIQDRFTAVLEHFGQSPFIVRSSSFLEDGFGNAFAGKYQSVFCPNQGSLAERMERFEDAVRTVYASTMDRSALEYRLRHGLQNHDEQMAVLVQRVSGSYFGKYFMPGAAGVGYSRSSYRWLPDMDPDAGMLRLVMGLGTRAVDRTGEDYPRLANLDRPTVTTASTVAQRHRFSQRKVAVIDCGLDALRELPLDELLDALPGWYRNLVLEHDTDAERRLRETGRPHPVWFANCEGLLRNERFCNLMRDLLATLQRVYGNPVDIEYTVNLDSRGDFVVNLLQCRPLAAVRDGGRVDLGIANLKRVFFEVSGTAMGPSCTRHVDVVVTVDPEGYHALPYRVKPDVARAVGTVDRCYRGSGKTLMLTAPGRLGTSSPELGVPVGFADIAGFAAVCEVSDPHAGYRPELSYGSHMFQDLVEAETTYVALLGDATTIRYDAGVLDGFPDRFTELCPDRADLAGVVRVREVEGLVLFHDAKENRTVCGMEGLRDGAGAP